LVLRGSKKTLLIYNKRKLIPLYSFMKDFISLSDLKNLHCSKVTRGPRRPWVAHLRKRAKATVEQIIENIIGA